MADPKFQFSRRWQEIAPALLSDDLTKRQDAITALEMNMRDAEDAWAGAGGTSKSILHVEETIDTISAPGPGAFGYSFSSLAASVPIPSDTTFQYYLDVRTNGKLLTTATSDCGIQFQGFPDVPSVSQGVGYELWGYLQALWASSGRGYYIGGFGNRMLSLPDSLAGTNVDVYHSGNWQSSDGSLTATIYLRTTIELIAIPK